MLLDDDPAAVRFRIPLEIIDWSFSFQRLFFQTPMKTDFFTLIHHTIDTFTIPPDKQAVMRVNESLATMQQSRELRNREAESALRKLSRNLKALETHHEETVAA